MSGERGKRPSYQWYPGDFRRDTAVYSLPFQVRSFWREMLDIMHDGEPYGHLTAGGDPIPPADLARMIGVRTSDAVKWLAILERRNVYSRTPEGVIYCRRMVRDHKTLTARIDGGKDAPQPNAKGGGKGGGKGAETTPSDPPPAFAFAFASAEEEERTPAASQPGSPECGKPVENSGDGALEVIDSEDLSEQEVNAVGNWTDARELAPFPVACALARTVLKQRSPDDTEADLSEAMKTACAKAGLGYDSELVRKALDAVRAADARRGV
jgi:hypothetical protein